jgi:hypothetical protein
LVWSKRNRLLGYRLFAISILPQWFFLLWIRRSPAYVDQFYSDGIFVWLSQFYMRFTAWASFSIGDFIYAIALFFLLKTLIGLKRLRHRSAQIKTLGWFGFLFFLFHLLWGLNYHQTPLSIESNIPSSYSSEELEAYTHHLIHQTNQLQEKLSKSDTVLVQVNYSYEQIFDVAIETIRKQHYYPTSNLKKSSYGLLLNYMGYGGYLNPFTLEAQVNARQPKLRLLTTSVHEIAHQLGYAAEEEANFIAIDAALKSDNTYMKYAGYHLALGYALSECRKRKDIDYKLLYQKMNTGVIQQYQELSSFWERYKNPLEPLFKKSYDTYLKANNQSAGINSYNLVLGLLLHQFQNN